MDRADASAVFESHRAHLMGVACRILGSISDSADAPQEAWLRWSRADRIQVQNSEAFLTTIVGRLALNHLRRARVLRETYTGPWLPEPIAQEPDPQTDPGAAAELADSLSMPLWWSSRRSRRWNAPRSSFVRCSSARTPRWWPPSAATRSPSASSCTGPATAWTPVTLATRPISPLTQPRWTASSRPARRPTSSHSWTYSPRMSSSSATAAAWRRPQAAGLRPGQGGPAPRRLRHAYAGGDHLVGRVLQWRPGIIARLDGVTISAMALSVADGMIQSLQLVANPEKLLLLENSRPEIARLRHLPQPGVRQLREPLPRQLRPPLLTHRRPARPHPVPPNTG